MIGAEDPALAEEPATDAEESAMGAEDSA